MPGSSSAKTRFALLPGHDECRHLKSQTQLHDLAARCARAVDKSLAQRGRGECRAPVAPAASCALVVAERTRVTTSTPESPGIPARNGFNGFLRALVSGLFCHRRLTDIRRIPTRLGGCTSANLTPASGRQDHTTSPYASASFVSSPFDRSRPFANPPCITLRA